MPSAKIYRLFAPQNRGGSERAGFSSLPFPYSDWTRPRHGGWRPAPQNCSPVPYFHIIFTLPNALDPIALANQRIVYDLLLRSAAETLLEVAADPKLLGARTGVLAVLHTWGQNLQLHPHVHCVVPGGGLSPDGTSWIASASNFFLPVRVLSRVFRGKFLAEIRVAFAKGDLRFAADQFEQVLLAVVSKDWVVYAKPPFGGPS
jgi:Putative transposase